MPIPPMIDDDKVIYYQYDSYINNGLPSLFTGPYSVSEVNERNAGKVQRNLTRLNEEAEKRLNVARESSNKVPPEVFNYIIEARKEHLPELIARVTEAHKVHEDPDGKSKRGLAPHPVQVDTAIREAQVNFARQVDNDVKEKYYASRSGEKHDILDWHVRQANREAGLESAPSGSSKLFSNMTESIYNEKKGGFQWGGIVGGIAGFALSSIFGAGGLLGTVIAIAMTMIGVSIGNKVADNYNADTGPVASQKTPTSPTPNPTPSPAPSQGLGTPTPGQEQGAPTPGQEQGPLESPSPEEWVKYRKGDVKKYFMANADNLGGLQPPALPAKPAQALNKNQNTL